MRTAGSPDARVTSARAADDAARVAAAQARSKLLRRGAAAIIIVAALAVVIGPHLIDGTRISSVVAQAAKDDGGPPAGVLTCPTDASSPLDTPTQGVVLAEAVVCTYPEGFASAPLPSGPVPATQLPSLTADLAAGSSDQPPTSGESADTGSAGTSAAWAVIGLTTAGQRIELLGRSSTEVYAWAGASPMRYWRPSDDVRRMLAADLPR